MAEASVPSWWEVETVLVGNPLKGFVANRFLVPEAEFQPALGEQGIREAHLKEGRPEVTRSSDSSLAFPLGEPDRPTRSSDDPAAHARELLEIVNYLAVDASSRYQPRGSRTFCNVYAYDYCYLAKVYLPRVWWLPSAIERLASGESLPVRYGITVGEMSANSLFTWLKDLGGRFGWTRVFSETELQDAANLGRVCLISAQRVDLGASGHIAAVVPENPPNTSKRDGGSVRVPLQSQAGASNFRFGTSSGRWWAGVKFRESGFWVHL